MRNNIEETKLKKLITESRELAKTLDKFADELEKKCVKSKKSISNNGFPYFMTELTEDDLEQACKNATNSD